MSNPILLFNNYLDDTVVTAPGSSPWGGAAWGGSPWGGDDLADNVLDFREYVQWEGLDTKEQSLVFDCGRAVFVNAVGIAGHNLKTAGCKIAWEASADKFLTSPVSIVAEMQPYSDKPLLLTHAAACYRYWRLRMTAGSAIPRIGVCIPGIGITLPMPPEPPYAPTVEEIESDIPRGRTGYFQGGIVKYIGNKTMVRLTVLERAWALEGYGEGTWGGAAWGGNGDIKALWAHARQALPFFYAWDLGTYPDATIYGLWKGAYQTPLSILAYIDSFEFEIESTMN